MSLLMLDRVPQGHRYQKSSLEYTMLFEFSSVQQNAGGSDFVNALVDINAKTALTKDIGQEHWMVDAWNSKLDQ